MAETPEVSQASPSESPEWIERYSRQTLLKGVGVEGQKKWAQSRVKVVGEGPALDSCLTALASSGLGNLFAYSPSLFDLQTFIQSYPQTHLETLSDPLQPVEADLVLAVNCQAYLRRRINRDLRTRKKPGLFAWPAASGFAIWLGLHGKGGCPCLECFEVLNPKAFNSGTPSVLRMLGQAAASEALLYLLQGQSPLENKVWITSLEAGVSIHHEVFPSYKCPAQLEDEGASVTP